MEHGKLYIVSTPIGNLEDITLRALRTLKEVDVIAAEDTRRTVKLLNAYDIKKKLMSFHEYSSMSKLEEILILLKQGKNVALVSDAGTPLISDPGCFLVQRVYDAGLEVVAVPGPCAAIAALTQSGMDTSSFLFLGFLPLKLSPRREVLNMLCRCPYTCIIYESPHKLRKTLLELQKVLGGARKIALLKELTKVYEKRMFGPIDQVIEMMGQGEIKGEFILVLEPCRANTKEEVSDQALMEMLNDYIAQGCSKKDAVQKTGQQTGIGKNRIYDLANQLNKGA